MKKATHISSFPPLDYSPNCILRPTDPLRKLAGMAQQGGQVKGGALLFDLAVLDWDSPPFTYQPG